MRVVVTKEELSAYAERLFNAYNAEPPNPWKTWDGKSVPDWAQINDQVRGKWMAVARVAMELL